MLYRTLVLGCALACSALLSQTFPAPTGQSTSATLIGPGGGGPGGGGGGTTAGITLRCNILGASSTPLTVSGQASHLGGDATFNLPWNGKITGIPNGRAVLQFREISVGTTNFQPLPSNRVLHYSNQNTCAVTYVPSSTVVGFISGLEITQGTQNSANSVPLEIGKKALLKIQGCGLNFSWANYTVDVTVNGQTTSFGLMDSVSPAVNNGAWDGDPIPRYASLALPDYLVWPGMMATVRLTNAPAAPFGRTDLFPTTMTISPTISIPSWGALPVRVILISQGGVTPPIHQNGQAWAGMMNRINTLLPWREMGLNMTYGGPVDMAELIHTFVQPWQQSDAKSVWEGITWGLYYRYGNGYPVIGIFDGTVSTGKWLANTYGGLTITSNGALLPAATIASWVDDVDSTAEVFAHEFGHTSGRRHAPSVAWNGTVAADPDYSFPYQNGNSSVGAMFTAFGANGNIEFGPSRGATGSGTEKANGQSHELMGYGGTWFGYQGTSDYTFGAIRQYWGIYSTVPGSGVTAGLAPATLMAQRYDLAPENIRALTAPIHPVPKHIQKALANKNEKAAYESIRETIVGIQ
ncbi:MAG: hypothetical protein IPP78_11415 [Holophagaceae bacterium]|nr:hypothetical protein [Holophagaceae bacterium]